MGLFLTGGSVLPDAAPLLSPLPGIQAAHILNQLTFQSLDERPPSACSKCSLVGQQLDGVARPVPQQVEQLPHSFIPQIWDNLQPVLGKPNMSETALERGLLVGQQLLDGVKGPIPQQVE